MTAELTSSQLRDSIAYFEGVADKLEARAGELLKRIDVGRSMGAEDPASKYFEHFKKLVDQWMHDGEQAEEYRLSANKLIFKTTGKDPEQ
jgi:deoxyadenosine/deoxycytidine kinase